MKRNGTDGGRRAGGSITVYLALTLAVMVSLILASITSVKIRAGRMQAANAMDQAMYSLFAKYDRQLDETYALFFLDAGSASGGLDFAACVDELEDAADYLLRPNRGRRLFGGRNLLHLTRDSCSLTGCTLATDAGGAAFRAEAVQAVKDTGGLALIRRLRERKKAAGKRQKAGREYLRGAQKKSYGSLTQQAAEKRRKEEERRAALAAEGVETEAEPPALPEGFMNPIPMLEQLTSASVLDLVAPDGVSAKKADPGDLVSGRSLGKGFGVMRADTGGSELAFKAYLLDHYRTYRNPSVHSVLSYQLEYILCGKSSDLDNMKETVRYLMLNREADNIACLYANPSLSRSLSRTADLIGLSLGVPELAPAFKLVLAGLWAYAESVVDLRCLLTGGRVSLMKQAAYWQTAPDSLIGAGADLDGLVKSDPSGLDYEEYLGIILLERQGSLVMRAMDMTEAEIRGNGNPGFRMDHCIYALSAEMKVCAEKRTTFPVSRSLCYGDL